MFMRAAKAAAKKVFSVEGSSVIAQQAEAIVRSKGFGKVIKIIKGK